MLSIVQGDPLGLFDLSEQRARDRALWLSPFRVCDESVFNVALLSLTLGKEDDLSVWLVERVDDAIDQLLRRDAEALRNREITEDLVAEGAHYLADVMGFEPAAAFRAAIRFNSLHSLARRTHFAVFVEGMTLAECLEAGLGPSEELRKNVELTSRTILDEVRAYRIEAGTYDWGEERD